MDLGGLGSSIWRLRTWRLNLKTGYVHEQEISSEQVEFPVVAPWRIGQHTRYVYAVRFQPHSPASFNAVLKFDLETGEETVHDLPEGINSRRIGHDWHDWQACAVPVVCYLKRKLIFGCRIGSLSAALLTTDCPKQNMWPDCCCPLVSFRSSLELTALICWSCRGDPDSSTCTREAAECKNIL